jgi:antitoxin component of RelBE/YafQ-DinJ toxin-antitoxin module
MPQKSETLIVRISPETKALLAAKAQALGITMSEYVRLLVLEDARERERTAMQAR